jgi:hypothetical protein
MGRHGNQPSANTVGTNEITDGEIINADVSASAAIAYSKLAALTDGNILVGNGSNVATSVNPSGDIDVTNAGVFSISSGVIVNDDVNSSAAIAPTKIDYSSAWVSAGAASLDGGLDTGDDNTLKFKVVEIGDWNMDSTASVSVAHGVSSEQNIRGVQVFVRHDTSSVIYPLTRASGASSVSGISSVNATNVNLDRFASGAFDSTDFDSTSFNRGWIYIWYTA